MALAFNLILTAKATFISHTNHRTKVRCKNIMISLSLRVFVVK